MTTKRLILILMAALSFCLPSGTTYAQVTNIVTNVVITVTNTVTVTNRATLIQVKPLTYAEGNGGTWLSPSAAQSDQFGNGWVEDRTADSTRYRETFPPFEQQADYIMRIKLPALDDIPFDIPRRGYQLAGPGMNRQIAISIKDIDLLPTFYKLTAVP